MPRTGLLAGIVGAITFLCSPLVGQPYGGDMLALESVSGNLARLKRNGSPTVIGSYGPTAHGLAMDLGNRHVVAAFDNATTGGHVLQIDLTNGSAMTVASGLGKVWGVKLDANGDYLVSTYTRPSKLLRVKRDGSSVTTVLTVTYAPIFEQDITTGDYLLTHASSQVLRYSPDFQTIRNTFASVGYSYEMASDPHQPMIYVASSRLYAIDTNTELLTTLNSTGVGPGLTGRALQTDRAPDSGGGVVYAGTHVISNTSSAMLRTDRTGTVLGTAFLSTGGTFVGATFDGSMNLGGQLINAPNDRHLIASFPTEAGRPYVVAMSVAGCFPGFPLPDGRRVPINPDSVTAVTTTQMLPPFITGNIGVLGPRGNAAVQLNLNTLGNAISGVRLWAVAVTLDPNAPLGISTISKPYLVVL